MAQCWTVPEASTPSLPRSMPPRPYFAYGSNLCLGRLRRRVPSARLIAVGEVEGLRLRWHKRGRDGSGKCSVDEGVAGSSVWGALFHIAPGHRELLHRVEGLGRGYREETVLVETRAERVEAWTYRAEESWVDEALRPFRWYRDLVVGGARALDLPGAYVEGLSAVVSVADPDGSRAARNLRDLSG